MSSQNLMGEHNSFCCKHTGPITFTKGRCSHNISLTYTSDVKCNATDDSSIPTAVSLCYYLNIPKILPPLPCKKKSNPYLY